LIGDVTPSSFILIYILPGVFNYYNLDLKAVLILMILLATALSSSFHCCKLLASLKTLYTILAP
jgi:hypothetical protein